MFTPSPDYCYQQKSIVRIIMLTGVVNKIKADMLDVSGKLDHWFDVDDTLLGHKPAGGGWSVREVLEHISLTNQFLLLIIRKLAAKAMERAKKEDYLSKLDGYRFNWEKLEMIGKPGMFAWQRPEHMEPTGNVCLEDVRATLKLQQEECMDLLDQLKDGQGVLYTIRMSVNDLGKIDVYHYIFFLVQHMKRHIVQMEELKKNI
jgi:hypothetical protein